MACGWNVFVSDKSSRNYRQIQCFRHCLQIVRTKSCYPKSWELVPGVFYWRSNDKKLANFLIHVLINDPERSEYFKQFPRKGIRTNFFFIADISKPSISNINAGGNGAYLKYRILTSFIIATTIELVLFVKTSVKSFIITKDYAESLTKKFTSYRIRS